jgi:hypothetical protein
VKIDPPKQERKPKPSEKIDPDDYHKLEDFN